MKILTTVPDAVQLATDYDGRIYLQERGDPTFLAATVRVCSRPPWLAPPGGPINTGPGGTPCNSCNPALALQYFWGFIPLSPDGYGNSIENFGDCVWRIAPSGPRFNAQQLKWDPVAGCWSMVDTLMFPSSTVMYGPKTPCNPMGNYRAPQAIVGPAPPFTTFWNGTISHFP